jgi:hypothetical protein
MVAVACASSAALVPAIASAQPIPHPPQPPHYPSPPGQWQPPSPQPPGQWQPPGPQPPAEWQPPPEEPEHSSGPHLYRALPILRVSPGTGIHIGPGGTPLPAFDLDIAAGVGLVFVRDHKLSSDLVIEASYSYSSHPTMGGHLAGVGVVPQLYLTKWLSLGWAPKLVLGATSQGFAIGMRNMVVAPLLTGLFQVEAGHQWLRVGGQDQHEIRVLAGIDVMRLTMALLFSQALRR